MPTLNDKFNLAMSFKKGQQRDKKSEIRVEQKLRKVTGTATSDSKDGKVMVRLVEGDAVEMSTIASIKNGDTVSVIISNGIPTVQGVIGWGDGVQAQADAAATTATKASSDAATAKEDAAAAIAETKDLVTLRIDSSRGTVFKNSEVSTVLTVRCYKRGQELTTLTALRQAMLDATARIRWYVLREGDTDWVSLADSDPMLSDDGFTLTVTPDDVTVKCTFKAEIVTD